MELRNLRAFVEVALRGSFTDASKTLHMTQSAVSKSVKLLEGELGVSLLTRVGPKSTMTAAGELVFVRAQQMLAVRDDMLSELGDLYNLKRGTLRIGLPPVGSDTLFAPLFTKFRSCYPDVDVYLVESGAKQLEQALRMGDVEIAAVLGPMPDEFDGLPVWNESIIAVCARVHPLAASRHIDFGTLANEPLILFDSRFKMHQMIVDACIKNGFSPKIVAESSQIPFMIKLAACGLGVTFLPRLVAEQYNRDDIALLELGESGVAWDMAIAWRRGAALSQAAKAWLALAKEVGKATSPKA
ncbi:LysR family transcriptional regulator [Burkholderia ubonensis]|uniref:LysR family transcriptional regulator n=1 Tax=Burkholderia ubonensis TaxID=101571 RepID=UPI00076D9CA7|nr:LysR family transcriptional regulator [Burkholderia ubonensis]KWB88643.1 LysR family transcriptional regulator [Burkholderia ubonensis]